MADNTNGQNLEDIMLMQARLLGRIAFPPNVLAAIVAPGSRKNDKTTKAYNLCDGTRTQAQVTKETGVDSGNLSRSVNKWIASGVLFRIGGGKDAKLMHLYPIDKDVIANES